MSEHEMPAACGLFDPRREQDSCGVGFVANVGGERTHAIVGRAIEVLRNLAHRGAMGGDRSTSDGAGILIQVPDAVLRAACLDSRVALPADGRYGVGMVFLPRDEPGLGFCVGAVEQAAAAEGLEFLGWREVPVRRAVLGGLARAQAPLIRQCFVSASGLDGEALERRLYVLRRQIEVRVAGREGIGDRFCIPSLSARTIVFKGLLTADQLSGFYDDLRDPALQSAIAVLHQRYSTNTFPSWKLAQPFRYLAHNGEINTLRGNLNQMRSRERSLASERFGADVRKLLPIIDESGSDSACLDNALELLVTGGRSLAHAMMMLIPQAWGAKYPIGPDERGFFEYHAGLMEPWDGPATVAFSDGSQVGAHLDRNGLRPARYTITRQGFMVLASETGVLDIPDADVAEKGALRPGQMILVDLRRRRVLKHPELTAAVSRRQPYRRWVDENRITVHGFFGAVAPLTPDPERLVRRQHRFGYTREDLGVVLEPMASKGHEPVGSMGTDTPLAIFSEKPQLLFAYFKQLFAQVTNPPIDPIREELVMSLMTFIGNPGNILTETPQHARLIKLRHPILSNEDLDRIRGLTMGDFRAGTVPIGFPAGGGGVEMEGALEQVAARAEALVADGRRLIVLSDRDLPDGEVPIPSLLATAAVNHHLVRRGLRTGSGIIVETGEAREVMHVALLLGYGATALNPYLAFESVAQMAIDGQLSVEIGTAKAVENTIDALCKGLLKTMSKMGISTLRSYRGAQVFEAIGLAGSVIDRFFTGTASRVGGIGLDGIAAEANARHAAGTAALARRPRILPSGGQYRYRTDGERHLWTPDAIARLQQAARTNDAALYRSYAALINDQAERQTTLRGLLGFRPGTPVPLAEVEPASAIVKRFVTGAMSFGSISREAHETIAIAMNRLGGMSNSGEGGEDPERYRPEPNGDSRCSAIKQVASGRFGVTAEYGVNCRDLQIKIAQGAKPGEGGQLPGHKVNAEIARVRHATPGVTLISPPPHHDIYSIEDIKQLIYDLRNLNPRARVSVKLVSEFGVGTVAAGVAKAEADVVLISGFDGGTGASPLSSIRHAGAPWELGLAEAQQTLVLNGLRGGVILQADGQMKTGRDVAIAALLGAEEFGFATGVLVVCGCVMMRQCHTNLCPVGVATQDPELRKHFTGRPEHVVNFLTLVAEEVRGIMAELGFRRMDDMVGRSDCLDTSRAVHFWKAAGVDLSGILARPPVAEGRAVRSSGPVARDLPDALDPQILPDVEDALSGGEPVLRRYAIRNVNRTVGAMISGEIARRYGDGGLPADRITLVFRGVAGQSFGAWAARGLTLVLEGEANDYLGKGLSGGRIVVRPAPGAVFDPSANVIAGNVLLYGATSGEAFIRGGAGERFAIRNSGAIAVVEGLGDHGCEYMTGGRVVVIGRTGVNFAAGMSGGIAYVYDEDGGFDSRCNLEMVDLEPLGEPADVRELRGLLERHVQHTASAKAREILDRWDESLPRFVKVFPMEYRRALGRMSREDEQTEREEVLHG